MIAILHAFGNLDIAAGTTLSQEENSKKQDANIVNIDFSASFNLPYSPANIQAYNRYGFEKFRCQLYSDGFLIGEYTAKIRENTFNHNDKTGSITIQLTTLYDSLVEDMDKTNLVDALDSISWTIDVTGTSPDTAGGEMRIHNWLAQEQNTPSGVYPFRFPEYGMVDKYDGTFPEPKYEADTMVSDENFGFGSWVPVNHFNNQYERLPDRTPATPGIAAFPDKYIKYNILYDRMSYHIGPGDSKDAWLINPGVTQTGTGFSHLYANDPQPRRIWGLACPCFPYLWVLEKALDDMGFRLVIEWDNADHKELFERLLILNNYNIFDVKIQRVEGYAKYYYGLPFGGGVVNWEDTGLFTYWLGGNNPIFPTAPTALEDYDTYTISAKNHVPNITVGDLVNDFVAKTNMEVVLDGGAIIFRKPIVIQDENKRTFAPEVKTQAYEWKMKKNLVYKYLDVRDDNIPDYKIVEDGGDEENIESPIVPVYIHEKPTGGIGAAFPFIVAIPAIDDTRNTAKVKVYKKPQFNDSTVVFPLSPLSWINVPPVTPHDEEGTSLYNDDVKSVDRPPFCGVYIPYYEMPRLGMYYFYDTHSLTAIASPYHLNGRTLKWQDSTGIYENSYKSYLSIFKAKLVHLFSELYNPGTFQRFSHYKYFNLLGRKVFGMKRKYTIPLSENPLIEYEGYEAE